MAGPSTRSRDYPTSVGSFLDFLRTIHPLTGLSPPNPAGLYECKDHPPAHGITVRLTRCLLVGARPSTRSRDDLFDSGGVSVLYKTIHPLTG